MFNKKVATWEEARQVCQKEGGYLASMSSKLEAVREVLYFFFFCLLIFSIYVILTIQAYMPKFVIRYVCIWLPSTPFPHINIIIVNQIKNFTQYGMHRYTNQSTNSQRHDRLRFI